MGKVRSIDAHRGEEDIRVDPPSEIFAKLVDKIAIKTPKRSTLPKKFSQPYIPIFPKFGKNLMDPPPEFSKRAHLWLKATLFNRTLQISARNFAGRIEGVNDDRRIFANDRPISSSIGEALLGRHLQ
jgi:hypothetical protein